MSSSVSTSSTSGIPPIQLNGISSGLPVDKLIQALLQPDQRRIDLLNSQISTIKTQENVFGQLKTEVSDLLAAVRKMATVSILDTNPFDAKLATSSNTSVATATASATASPQSVGLEVITLATATKAASTSTIGQWMTGVSLLSDVARQTVTDGTFTAFVDGVANSINVDTTQDVNSVLGQLNALGLTATVNATGQIVVQKNGHTLSFGGSGDTSNFLTASNLQTGTDSGVAITASAGSSIINLGVAVSSGSANLNTPVADGTFTIGTATFDTTGKTLGEIITDINNNSAAGATASYNAVTNKLELTSKKPGSALISMSDGSGNFLTAMGLITGGDSTLSQTAGTNAQVKLNGSTVYSPTNTLDASLTGLTGVTINLLGVTTGTPITITISNDTATLKTDIQDFITKYNKVITDIDTVTNAQNKAPLAGQNQVLQFRQHLRSMVTAGVSALSGTGFDSLMQAGISTGAVTGTAGNVVPTLTFDAAKFDAAMAANPDTIRLLFTGKDLTGADDGTNGDDNVNGVITQIESFLSSDLRETSTGSGVFTFGALYSGSDTQSGLFAAFKSAADKRIESINDSITAAQERMTQKQLTLQKQFTAMENLIAQFQSQGSALTGLSNQLSSNNSSK